MGGKGKMSRVAVHSQDRFISRRLGFPSLTLFFLWQSISLLNPFPLIPALASQSACQPVYVHHFFASASLQCPVT